jgi:single-strand DNA-binding protein
LNNLTLQAIITRAPELRTTQNGQTLAEMLLEFPAQREGEPNESIKAICWGNLAQEAAAQYGEGQAVLVEGRLTINQVQMESHKDYVAELNLSKIHPVLAIALAPIASASVDAIAAPPAQAPAYTPVTPVSQAQPQPVSVQPVYTSVGGGDAGADPNYDDIPFRWEGRSFDPAVNDCFDPWELFENTIKGKYGSTLQ